eukprot:COSAG06_NODE_29717_length_551_cov_1.137168_1_plen_77_part_10
MTKETGDGGASASADAGVPALRLTARAAELANCWWEGHTHATAASLVAGLLQRGRSGILPSEGAILFAGYDDDHDGR